MAVIAFLLLTFLASVTVICFGNKVRKFRVWSFVLFFIVDFVTLPPVYIMNGEFISGVPVYFILGIVYCMIAFTGKTQKIMVSLCTAVDSASIVFVFFSDPNSRNNDIFNQAMMTDIVIHVLLCALISGIAVKYKLMVYENEKSKAEEEIVRAAEMNATKDTFMVNMSHEIRTPMNAILGTAEIMLTDESTEPAMKENISYIINACDVLLASINDMLDSSKTGNSKIELMEKEYQLKPLLDDIVNMINVRLLNSGIDFQVNIDRDIPGRLYGDPARIREIFINLLNNAVKYTEHGYIRLNAGCTDNGNQTVTLHAEIEDTGIGIRREKQGELFNTFQRIDDNEHESSRIEGSGLGLSICKEIIDAMNGKISVQSEYNKGSVFSFELVQKIIDRTPAADERISDRINDKVSSMVRSDNFKCPEARVLIIDDNPVNLKVAAKILSKYGINVSTATGGKEALNKLMIQDQDMILIDYMMPDMDGIDTLKAIKALKKSTSEDVPCIVLTADTAPGAAKKLLQAGFNDYLSKPIELSVLDEIIKKYMKPELIVRKADNEQDKGIS